MDEVPTSFCSHCGKKRDANHKFCLNCGKKFPLTKNEEKLIEKWGTESNPTLKENFKGMFTNPSKTLERIYDTKNNWEPGFIIVVFFGILVAASSFIILLKTNFTIIGTDIDVVNNFIENILYFKIYLAIFDAVIAIIQWIISILLFKLLLFLLKKNISFEKITVIGEYAAISLIFIGLINLIIALFMPLINSTLNVDNFSFDFNEKINAILNSNLDLLILSYTDYPLYLIFDIILGFGLKFKKDLNKYTLLLIISFVFIIGQVVLPLIM